MSAKSINIAVILVLVFLSLAMLANSMTKPLGRDEQMYCTGGVLMANGKMIYRDFSYAAQMPYHPLLYASVFRILNTTHYLLVGRVVSVFCDIAVLVCIVGIYRRIFKDFPTAGAILGLAAAVLYVFNPLVDYANGYAWNHDVVISGYWKIAAMGGLLTFATWMRVTTAMVELLFLVMLLVHPADSTKQRVKTILPFLIAAACVSVWPVWLIVQAPRAFFLNIVKIPALYGEWLERIGMVHNKFDLTLRAITRPGYLVLIAAAVYLCVTTVCLRRKLKIMSGKNLLFAALLPVVFFIIAFIPPTMWEQYLAMPVPFLVIGLAYPLLYLKELADKSSQGRHFKIAAALTGVCVFVAVASYPIAAVRTAMLLEPESWVPIQLHKVSEDIAQRTKEPKLALTLAPLFALEGGCEIYTELSAGSIIYRIADLMSPDERSVTHTVGPETLQTLLENSPPSAVITGVEFEFLEKALLESAVRPDWERKVYQNGPVVYFRP
jgi:hypothetical protein